MAVTQPQPEPVLGSAQNTAENPYKLQARFTPWGGGIIDVLLSRYSTDVGPFEAYPVQSRLLWSESLAADGTRVASYLYPMAAQTIVINGTAVPINSVRWEVVADRTSETAATFALTIVDGSDKPVLRIVRTWSIEAGRYDLKLDQRVENLSDKPLAVSLSQYGVGDLPGDGGYMGDRREVVLGYLNPLRSDETQKYVTTQDFHLMRSDVVGRDTPALWPAAEAEPGRDLAWVATANRYFAATVSAPVGRTGDRLGVVPLEGRFSTIRRESWGSKDNGYMLTVLDSPTMALAPGASQSMALEMFAGPKDPEILKVDEKYTALKLGELIVYNLGGMCAFCTFSFVADALLAFLKLIDLIVRDWGLAIIALVAVVRLILHPLTVRSQVNMMKMSKQMAALQPEIEKLKQKFGSDQQKLNGEMMKLYKERGVNPAAMGLGCVPMFLQMPIWFALYAMLYYAIELRHQPAFYGVFQWISGGNWSFLADLSSADHFFRLPREIDLYLFKLDSINLLPLLMAGVFYLQQKYTMQAPAMNEQARQQQAIMKWMVLLFPLFLYKAPSGLNLYILTSTAVGIVESQRVRKRVKALEESGKLFAKKPPKPGGFMDRLSKMAEERMKQAQASSGPASGPGKGTGPGSGDGKKRRK
jgi:YidC/Oxa1 family membrane protein insertase